MSCTSRSNTDVDPHRRRVLATAGALAVAAALNALPRLAHAASLAAPAVPAAVRQALVTPVLSGGGTFTYWGFHVYDAWLWVGPLGLDPHTMDRPFALALRYARDFAGKDIADRSAEEIAKLRLGTDAEQAAWLGWMQAHFPDVKDGDLLIGLYQPKTGISLLLNGKQVAVSDDDAYARAFFSIWLDERTTGPKLRAALLERARPS